MDTTSLGFQKPKEEEYYDINIFNKNTQLTNDLIEKNSSAIGQLSNTRGYSKIPIINTDILLKNTNGWCRGYNIPNAPIQNTWLFYRTVIMDDSFPWGYGFIRAYDYENKKEFVNFRSTSGWEGWREIPTVNNISNPNLVINGDFQIWQRGTSFTSFLDNIVTYTADRWYVAKAPGTTVSVIKDSDNSLKFSQTGLGSSHIAQFIEGDYSNLVGKKLTMSICSKSNVDTIMAIFDYTIPINSRLVPASTEYTIKSLTVQLPNSITKDRLRCLLNFANNQGSINIKWIKLELGEISTPLSPRSYGEEKFLCQRYCVSGQLVGTPYNIEASNIWSFIPFNQKLRINPTLSNLGNLSVKANNGIIQTGFTFSNMTTTENGIYLLTTKIGHGLTISNSPHIYSSTAIFDSEIY